MKLNLDGYKKVNNYIHALERVGAKNVPTTEEVEKDNNDWEPLTDEEINKYQNDLEDHGVKGSLTDEQVKADFEAYHPVVDFSTGNNDRDNVVIVPERDDDSSKEKTDTDKTDQDLHFDFSDATIGDIANNLDRPFSKEDFEAAKNKVMELVKKQKDSADMARQEQKAADESKAKAEEIKLLVQEKEALVAEKMAKLQDYKNALEEDCEFNERSAEAAREEKEASDVINK